MTQEPQEFLSEVLSEREADLQRYSQLRDEIHDLTRTIPQEVQKLAETHKRLLAHFDVFKSLSGEVKDQIHDALHQAATCIADQTAKQLICATQERLTAALTSLEHTLHKTETHLKKRDLASQRPWKRSALVLALLIGGMSLGFLLPGQLSPFLSQEARVLSQWGQALHQAWPHLSPQQRQQLKELLGR